MFNCACVYEFHNVCMRGAQLLYFVEVLLFRDNVQTNRGGGGAGNQNGGGGGGGTSFR